MFSSLLVLDRLCASYPAILALPLIDCSRKWSLRYSGSWQHVAFTFVWIFALSESLVFSKSTFTKALILSTLAKTTIPTAFTFTAIVATLCTFEATALVSRATFGTTLVPAASFAPATLGSASAKLGLLDGWLSLSLSGILSFSAECSFALCAPHGCYACQPRLQKGWLVS